MKKTIVFAMILVLILSLTQSAFADGNGTDEAPVVTIRGDRYAYIDDYCAQGIYIDKVDNLEYAEIVVHYDPEVLEYARLIRPTSEILHTHNVSVRETGSGELLIRIRKEYDKGCRGENEAMNYLDFYGKKEGETGLSAEVKEAVCSDGSSIELDITTLPKETSIHKFAEAYVSFAFEPERLPYLGIPKGGIFTYDEILEMEMITKNACLFQDVSFLLQYDPALIQFSKKTETKPGYSIDFIEDGKIAIHYKASDNPDFIFQSEGQKLQYVLLGGDAEVYITMIKNETLDGEKIIGDFSPFQVLLDPITISVEENETILTISGASPLVGRFDDYFENKRSHLCETPENIEEVKIEEGITGIGTDVFAEYVNLKDIFIPKTVVYIKNGAIPIEAAIHANSMSPAERYATVNGNPFVMAESDLIGDTDRDGILTADDALDILYMAAKLSPEYRFTADITGDGIVDASDALEILKIAAKLL